MSVFLNFSVYVSRGEAVEAVSPSRTTDFINRMASDRLQVGQAEEPFVGHGIPIIEGLLNAVAFGTSRQRTELLSVASDPGFADSLHLGREVEQHLERVRAVDRDPQPFCETGSALLEQVDVLGREAKSILGRVGHNDTVSQWATVFNVRWRL
jgi:hypothetical protein